MRIFLSGPSGVGKSTIIKAVLQQHTDIVLSISFTTRLPRPGEQDGREYFFVTPEAFQARVTAGRFLEWATVHDHLYGTSLDWVMDMEAQGRHVLFDIDVQGVQQAQSQGSPGCYIMLLPPDMDELARRLTGRGTEDPQAVATRIENARRELRAWEQYDYLVVNDRLEQAVVDVETLIAAYRLQKSEVIRRVPWLSRIA